MPGDRGYATSDLWERHPTKDYLWKLYVFHPAVFSSIIQPKFSVGRVDDVIIHSSGEKTVPAPMEDIILSSHM
jgi:hypothetical protein